jgi:hypothetical protein
MTSELKSATSRANGAKSHGPTTAEGKEKSSQNSLNHGFTAKKTILLQCENQEQFQKMQADYTVTYQPGSPVQEYLVSEMVACRWRMQRLRLIETALIDSEMDRELPDVETPEDPGYQLAFAFRRLVDESRAISLASRYESRLHRIHEQSHRTLRELQNNPSVSAGIPEPVSSAPVQPEPSAAGPELVPTQPAEADKKSRNEPTAPAPAATIQSNQPLSILGYRSFRPWGGRSCRLPRSIAA